MQSRSRLALTAMSMALTIASASCALGPVEGEETSDRLEVSFWGFVEVPNVSIRLRAYDPIKRVWIPLRTASGGPLPNLRASSTSISPESHFVKLYWFGGSGHVPAQAFVLNGRALVTAETYAEGSWHQLAMFSEAGSDCMVEGWSNETAAGREPNLRLLREACNGLNEDHVGHTSVSVVAPRGVLPF